MAIENNFIFYANWLDNIRSLPVQVQDKIISDIVRYGTDNMTMHDDDPMVDMAVSFTKN